MPFPDDIHPEEQSPGLNRTPQRPHTRIPGASISPPEPGSTSYRPGHSLPGSPVRSSHRRRRRRRPGEPDPEQIFLTRNKLLWLGLSGVVFVYLFFLVRTNLPSRSAPAPAPDAIEAAPTESPPPPSPLFQEETEQIQAKIREWDTSLLAAQDAYALLDRRNFAKAEIRLETARAASPAMIDLQLAQTRVFIEQKKYDPAKEILLTILDADPARASARLALATILSAQKNYAAALATGKWVLQADPVSLEALQVVANAHIAREEHSQALPYLRKIVTQAPDDIVAQNNLAVVYTRVGQFDRAEAVFNELLDTKPDNSITHYNLAVCYVLQGKTEKATELLNRAALQFGSSFVYTWLQGPDFDPIREDNGFADLYGRLASAVLAPDQPAPPAPPADTVPAPEPAGGGESAPATP